MPGNNIVFGHIYIYRIVKSVCGLNCSRFTADTDSVYTLSLLIPEALRKMTYDDWNMALMNEDLYHNVHADVDLSATFEVSFKDRKTKEAVSINSHYGLWLSSSFR
jgi:hypothetical protein